MESAISRDYNVGEHIIEFLAELENLRQELNLSVNFTSTLVAEGTGITRRADPIVWADDPQTIGYNITSLIHCGSVEAFRLFAMVMMGLFMFHHYDIGLD